MAAAVGELSYSVSFTVFFSFCILLSNLNLFLRATAGHCYLFNMYLHLVYLPEENSRQNDLDVEFEPPHLATSNEETHAGLDRTDHTVSKVITKK